MKKPLFASLTILMMIVRCVRSSDSGRLLALWLIMLIPAYGGLYHGVLPTSITQQDAIDAWNDFKAHELTASSTPDSNMLRASLAGIFNGDTAGEFQSWALVMAVVHGDHDTAQKLWNYCKYYIPGQQAGLVPWRITPPNSPSNWSVGDACFDYAIALDMAARKWPDYVDNEGKSWADWAEYYINSIYAHYRAIETNPASPNAISGKGYDTMTHLYANGLDEHYYLHYSPYGYFINWQARSGNPNWTEPLNGLPSVYETEIGLQRWNLSSYYGDTSVNNVNWPLHQVRKNGTPADDMTNVYDSPWDVFNHDSGRVTLRAAHAYTNYGDTHGAKMMRFIADRFWAETGGNPALIRTGYKGIGSGAGGWGAPNSWMIGNAAVAAMVDEEYRPMLDNMAQALADYDPATSQRPALYRTGKAYYLMHLVGLMDFRIENNIESIILYDDQYQNDTEADNNSPEVTTPTWNSSAKAIGKSNVTAWQQVGINKGPTLTNLNSLLRFYLYVSRSGGDPAILKVNVQLDNSAVNGGWPIVGLDGTSAVVHVNDQLGFNWENNKWNKVEIELRDLAQFQGGYSKLRGLRVQNHSYLQGIYLDQIELLPSLSAIVLYDDAPRSGTTFHGAVTQVAQPVYAGSLAFGKSNLGAWQQIGLVGGPTLESGLSVIEFYIWMSAAQSTTIQSFIVQFNNYAVGGGYPFTTVETSSPLVTVNGAAGLNFIGGQWQKVRINLNQMPGYQPGISKLHSLRLQNNGQISTVYMDEVLLMPGPF